MSMKWNWQLAQWPQFSYDPKLLLSYEEKFLWESGGASAVIKYLDKEEKKHLLVEILSSEGVKSAAIEGEFLERESLQSSIQRNLGLKTSRRRALPKEQGMADLICHQYESYDSPLTHEMLYKWHRCLIPQHSGIEDWGKYRTHEEPMQIVSRKYGESHVYFEAPPSCRVKEEMSVFITWFNSLSSQGNLLAHAAIMHLYFESIHPFEDGNGRIGRVLVEKLLSRKLGQPTFLAISQVIEKRRKEYYAALGECNCTLSVDKWVLFFAEVILQAQEESIRLINFLIQKSKMMTSLEGRINKRQEKVLLRIFSEGVKGFDGGLSAENYLAITKTSRATATRDLSDLVEKGALKRTGERRYTRYWLNL